MYEHLTDTIKDHIPRPLRQWLGSQKRKFTRKSRFITNLAPTDTFLVGHPKSGNTWLAYMLGIVKNRDTQKRLNISSLRSVIPTLHNRDDAITIHDSLPAPRIFRNEAPLFPELYPRTIYLVRDPRSVLLSYYYHCVHDTGRDDWPIGSFVDEILTHGCIRELEPELVRWDIQAMDWSARAKNQPVLILKYEEMKSNQREILERTLDFLGLPRHSDIIDLAVRRTGFNKMRSEEETYGAESYHGEKGKRGFFVRKGEVDSWKTELPLEDIRKIEAAFEPAMRQFGYAPWQQTLETAPSGRRAAHL